MSAPPPPAACDHCGAPARGSKGKAVIGGMDGRPHHARLCLACYNDWSVYGPHYTERIQWP